MSNERPFILGIDLEGINVDLIESGVNLKIDRVIEVGAVLWDCQKNQPVKIISQLIDESDRLPISNEVEELTGIDDEMLSQFGLQNEKIKEFLEQFASIIENADYLMAHNADGYDRPMLQALFERFNVPVKDKTWIDTMTDVEYPRMIKGRSMALLEHAHGFINPFPHRAVTDVLSMLKIASNYSFSRLIKMANSQKVRIVAPLSPPNWRSSNEVYEFNKVKGKISRAKFRWNPENKIWSKMVHQILIDEGKINFDFEWFIREEV